jgi:hypothetical protein
MSMSLPVLISAIASSLLLPPVSPVLLYLAGAGCAAVRPAPAWP